MWFALRASYLVAVVLCNVQQSFEDEDTKRSFLARRAIDGSRGRKYYDAKEDGFFDDYGFDTGHYGSEDRSGISDIRSNVPGEPGIDYPAYERLPRTSFSCEGRDRGYYADDEAGCQMFHVCDNILVSSFLCPVGSLFSQKLLTCDWWNKVDCSSTQKFYTINKNLYHQDDGDEMIRKAYVMMHLHPDAGITTEPEERERQGKIVHYSGVDAPENDLPNNYEDFPNDQEFRQLSPTFDDYSNQFKVKTISRVEDHYNDHVLYSQEYQTHAPKINPDSPIIRIHKITNDHHLAYQNRQQSNNKEQSSYRFPVNEFENEFQPSYAPTVPTVTTTTRRFYSPTVPMTYRSSTLAYNKLDQNFDSSIHLYAHGKNSLSSTTPATVFAHDSRNQKNSTRGSKKFEDSSNVRKESKEEAVERGANYKGREDDYIERETYDQLYDEEQEKFEIMEGRESIGLVRSSSERLGETTAGTPLPLVDESKTEFRSSSEGKNRTLIKSNNLNLNLTIQNKDLKPVNYEFKKEASNLQEIVTSSNFNSKELANKSQDLQDYPAFTEATNVKQSYQDSNQKSKDDYESKTEENPAEYHDDRRDLSVDVSTTVPSASLQNEDIIVEDQSNQGMFEQKVNDESRSTESSEIDVFSKDDDYSKEHSDNSKDHYDYSKEHDDYSKDHVDLTMASTTSHPIYNIVAQLLHPQEEPILELSPILQPPLETFKPFHINVKELIPQVSTIESQPLRIPIPYQQYSNVKENNIQPNLTENSFHEKPTVTTEDENPGTTSGSNLPIITNFKNSTDILSPSGLKESVINIPATDIIPPLQGHDEGTSEFVSFEQKDDENQLNNSSNHQVDSNTSPSSILQETLKFNKTNRNYEAQILRKYNPNLDFTIRSALWNQPQSSENTEVFESSTLIVENPFLNHRSISLELEPPNEDPAAHFGDDLLESNSRNVETTTEKFEDKENVFEVSSTLRPELPSSISEIEDTIEESNAPYQVTLTVNGNTDPDTLEKDFISRLINQHEKGSFQGLTNFEDFEIVKSEQPTIPETHEKPSIVYSKDDSSLNPIQETHFRPRTESKNFEENLETHNRSEKNAEIRNLDADLQRMSILQLMSELAKANRLPRPFSPREGEISGSATPKSSKESPSRSTSRTSTRLFANSLLSSASRSSVSSSSSLSLNQGKRNNLTLQTNSNQSNLVSSTQTPFLRKEEILEQLEKSFGQPIYGNQREPLFELPKEEIEPSLELPEAEGIMDFKTGKATVQTKFEQDSEVNSEASLTSKILEKEVKTVVEMEFVPSLGFSFDTHEGREEYAQAVLKGLVTEEAVPKSDDKFSTSTVSFESTDSTKNFEKRT